jgi:hypothetical protein
MFAAAGDFRPLQLPQSIAPPEPPTVAPPEPSMLEGIFAATLSAMSTNHPDRVVTNGSFHLPRTADRE